ncbi:MULTISPECIES: 23S rRNA (uracil(1939)-C(5))-methyltransferase RlmD [Leuconostoc]|uniref:RNA methyltransferase n=2 Tax=Leuconostoc kimchii TaxID=136609 RepID=D5T4V1_LEUKI|nr:MULTISPECIES: 23S rRNA (uracil(1939)-C(5))-methyltransferase RlmD [Leuconostoc]ADG41103.1 RNA methyltransferase [Leuconostoc kimchii IMSNU 11154]AEJ30925.1 RNA methyltransferase [Leuconostoc sp. C2]QBR48023.1 23S rRNA (uracil(1939)-C(5))-methyltransferase RlmD [Leuconostoc kimchii]
MAKANRVYKTAVPVTKNQEIEGEVIDITYQGMGVVKIDNFPIFVIDAIPGEVIKVGITKVLKNYAFGRVVSRIQESSNRAEHVDKVAITTGIAPLANLKYDAQLAFKQHQIEQMFKKVNVPVEVKPTIGMADPTKYRNKAQVPVQLINGRLETGFYRRGSHKLVPVEDFYIQDPKVDEAVTVTRDILRDLGLSAYDEETNKGVVRHIMARRGYYSHELMVVIITNTKKLPEEQEIATRLQAKLPELKSFIHNINNHDTNVIMGQWNETVWGEDEIHDQLMGKDFVIGPNSFYQVNPQTTATLYTLAAEKAGLKKTDTVVDAYSGIGTITLSIADKVKKIYGVEVVENAVEDAEKNAKNNHIDNVEFVTADAPEQMVKWAEDGLKPNVVFVDPPRKGLTSELISAVSAMKPETFVYISCNPATLARDAVQILAEGFEIDGAVQPLDQFPQTTHVESVTVFKRVTK